LSLVIKELWGGRGGPLRGASLFVKEEKKKRTFAINFDWATSVSFIITNYLTSVRDFNGQMQSIRKPCQANQDNFQTVKNRNFL